MNAGWRHRTAGQGALPSVSAKSSRRSRACDRGRRLQAAAADASRPSASNHAAEAGATARTARDEASLATRPPIRLPLPTAQARAASIPANEQHTGRRRWASRLASFRTAATAAIGFLVLPGDDVKLTFPTAGTPPKADQRQISRSSIFYESKMSEYDASFVFVPIRKLQELRGMIDPADAASASVTSIQIKLQAGRRRPPRSATSCASGLSAGALRPCRPGATSKGRCWPPCRWKPTILNVLLFLIIAVAGFGILAIFFMIVVEKTRDIGILKSLGASGRGVMGIFLGYGLSLGMVGSGVGLVVGLLFVDYINEIADAAGLGHRPAGVRSRDLLLLQRFPRSSSRVTVAWIVLGAMVIAVLASVLPARRARQAASRGGAAV